MAVSASVLVVAKARLGAGRVVTKGMTDEV